MHEVGHLASARVGAVAGNSTEDALLRLRISYKIFATPEDDLKALRAHSIDAFVYDKPLLGWMIRQNFSSSIELIDVTFDSRNYAFALPSNSQLRKSVNVAVVDAIRTDWWKKTTFRYLGSR